MATGESPPATREDYTIGWISALAIESAAAAEMLDEEDPPLVVLPGDTNNYVLGRIGQHRVVMAYMGETGGLTAHTVATQMTKSFPSVRNILLVGIGAGIPSDKCPIRLGDVVVSEAQHQSAAVIQCDFGKEETDGFKGLGALNRPPDTLVRATGAMKRNKIRNRSLMHGLVRHFDGGVLDPEKWRYQGSEKDLLHALDQGARRSKPCEQCTAQNNERDPDPEVYYGTIASGNQAVKNRAVRYRLRDEFGAICLEKEAFGLMNQFPCLVIRGIWSYADEDEDDSWQQYAALTAAAYAKELSLHLPLTESLPEISDQLDTGKNLPHSHKVCL